MADITAGRISIPITVDSSGASGGLDALEAALKKLQERADEAKANMRGLEEEFAQAQRAGDTGAMEEIQAAYRDTNNELARLVAQMARYREAAESAGAESEAAGAAHVSFRQRLRELREELYTLEEAGETQTEAYRKLALEIGQLEDQMADVNAMTRHLASDTMYLDEVLGGVSLGAGVFSTAQGAVEAFGFSMEGVEEAQRKLQGAIAITTGLQSIQNALQKQSALMLGIQRVQEIALAKAKQLEAKGTWAATVAQKAFNAAAKANPYVLLAAALVAVVAVMVKMARDGSRAAEQMSRLDDAVKRTKGTLASITNEGDFMARMAEAAGESEERVQALRVATAKLAWEQAELAKNEARRMADGIKNRKRREEAEEKVRELVEAETEAWERYNAVVQDGLVADRRRKTEQEKAARERAEERRRENARKVKEQEETNRRLLDVETAALEEERKLRQRVSREAIEDGRARELQGIIDEAEEAVRELQGKIETAEAGTSPATLDSWMRQQEMVREDARRRMAAKRKEWDEEDREADRKRTEEEQEAELERLRQYEETLALRVEAAEDASEEELRLMLERVEAQRQLALAEDELATGGQNAEYINKKYDKIAAALRKCNNASEKARESFKRLSDGVSKLGGYLAEIGRASGNEGLAAFGEALSDVADIAQAVAEGFAAGGPVGAALAGAEAALDAVVKRVVQAIEATREAREHMEEVTRQFEMSMYRMRLAVEEAKGSLFGEDSVSYAQTALRKAKEAKAEFDRLANEVNPLTGAYRVTGFDIFAGWQREHVELYELFPELFDENGRPIADKVRELLSSGFFDTEHMTDEQKKYMEWLKQTFEQILAAWDGYEEAMEAYKSEMTDIFGYLGGDAVDAITDAIANGTNAWANFKDAGVEAMEEIARRAIYEKYLSSAFDDLQARLDAATDEGLDAEQQAAAYAAALDGWFAGAEGMMGRASAAGQALADTMRGMGFDVFGSGNAGGLSGSIRTITEHSASVIAGQTNAIRQNQVDGIAVMRQQLLLVSEIKNDTAYLRSIDQRLSRMEGNGNYVQRMR